MELPISKGQRQRRRRHTAGEARDGGMRRAVDGFRDGQRRQRGGRTLRLGYDSGRYGERHDLGCGLWRHRRTPLVQSEAAAAERTDRRIRWMVASLGLHVRLSVVAVVLITVMGQGVLFSA